MLILAAPPPPPPPYTSILVELVELVILALALPAAPPPPSIDMSAPAAPPAAAPAAPPATSILAEADIEAELILALELASIDMARGDPAGGAGPPAAMEADMLI